MLLHYADASADYDSSYFVILGVPYDSTSSFRHGSKFAPDEIRKASYNLESFSIEHGISLRNVGIHDMGNIVSLDEDSDISGVLNAVNFHISKILDDGKFPIMIGGEHSITAGACKSLKSRDAGVIFLDAHADFRDSYMGSKYSHACVARRCLDYLNGKVASIGVRSISEEEFGDAKKVGFKIIDSIEFSKMGWRKSVDDALKVLKANKIYLSVDVDVIDPSFAPGTGTPEYFGLNPWDVKNIIDYLAPKLIGFDMVEVNPVYDNGNTSVLAARLIQEVIYAKYKSIKFEG